MTLMIKYKQNNFIDIPNISDYCSLGEVFVPILPFLFDLKFLLAFVLIQLVAKKSL